MGEDIADLQRRVEAGDAGAMLLLGKRLLVGEGCTAAPEEAMALVQASAHSGVGEAAALLSVLSAWGVGRPADLDEAFVQLRRAAGLGHARAKRELLLLESGGALDAEVLTCPPLPSVIRDDPRIVLFESFATGDECDWLIALGERGLRRALVYQGTPHLATSDVRTNREADYTVFKSDVAHAIIGNRVARAAGAPMPHFEVAKLLHYQPGQSFALHADFLEITTPALRQEIARRGQRVMTFLIYLNDDYSGGETDFPGLALRHKGRKGDALLFANVDGSGSPDYRTLHAGLPPTNGEKWLYSQWIRDRPIVP